MKNIAKKMWRDSASLIIMARNQAAHQNNCFDYDFLVFKRSEKTSFMKNSIVFPGGQTEKADDSKDWISWYKSLGITDSKLKEVSKVSGPRPMLFHKNEDDNLEREISLRITAIRETFEEMGVLICKNQEQFKQDDLQSNFVNKFDIPHWQQVVHNDASQFLVLCKELGVAPDLWGSYEWSAWLTPTALFSKRFEVAFFIVSLEEKPEIFPEVNEVQDYMWANPKHLIQSHRDQKLWLPPPQQYDLARFVQLKKMDDITKFAKERNSKGTTLFFPYQYKAKDRFVTLLPGDDMYPAIPDYNNSNDVTQYEDMTAEEMRKGVVNLHRTEYTSMYDSLFYSTITPFDGHLHPVGNLAKENKL